VLHGVLGADFEHLARYSQCDRLVLMPSLAMHDQQRGVLRVERDRMSSDRINRKLVSSAENRFGPHGG